jgi:hypothetical protein
MPRRNPDTGAILRTIERGERRSALFWWFVENHDAMRHAARTTRIDWASFCAEAVRQGLTDTRGRAPTARNARETWRQARRAVAASRQDQTASGARRGGASYPSRLPTDWQPPTVPPPPGPPRPAAPSAPPPHSTPPHPVPAGSRSSFASPHAPPEVRAILAEVEAKLRRADGYLGLPSKRKPTDV